MKLLIVFSLILYVHVTDHKSAKAWKVFCKCLEDAKSNSRSKGLESIDFVKCNNKAVGITERF